MAARVFPSKDVGIVCVLFCDSDFVTFGSWEGRIHSCLAIYWSHTEGTSESDRNSSSLNESTVVTTASDEAVAEWLSHRP